MGIEATWNGTRIVNQSEVSHISSLTCYRNHDLVSIGHALTVGTIPKPNRASLRSEKARRDPNGKSPLLMDIRISNRGSKVPCDIYCVVFRVRWAIRWVGEHCLLGARPSSSRRFIKWLASRRRRVIPSWMPSLLSRLPARRVSFVTNVMRL